MVLAMSEMSAWAACFRLPGVLSGESCTLLHVTRNAHVHHVCCVESYSHNTQHRMYSCCSALLHEADRHCGMSQWLRVASRPLSISQRISCVKVGIDTAWKRPTGIVSWSKQAAHGSSLTQDLIF